MLVHTIKERNNSKVGFTVQSNEYVQVLLKWGCNSEDGSSFLTNVNTIMICEDLILIYHPRVRNNTMSGRFSPYA